MNRGDIISYLEMCQYEGYSLQRGMNFRVKEGRTVVLMSLRKGAPYSDILSKDGTTLVYEGHDVGKNIARDPKSVDQPMETPNGTPTQNGKFYKAAKSYARRKADPEQVGVYEKIKDGIWVYNGEFLLVDATRVKSERRYVFKFKLELTNLAAPLKNKAPKHLKVDLMHSRFIPSDIKRIVYERDKGRCVICGDSKNIHFDHILPFSKGGTSLKAENIQILCAKHNLQKRAKIE